MLRPTRKTMFKGGTHKNYVFCVYRHSKLVCLRNLFITINRMDRPVEKRRKEEIIVHIMHGNPMQACYIYTAKGVMEERVSYTYTAVALESVLLVVDVERVKAQRSHSVAQAALTIDERLVAVI